MNLSVDDQKIHFMHLHILSIFSRSPFNATLRSKLPIVLQTQGINFLNAFIINTIIFHAAVSLHMYYSQVIRNLVYYTNKKKLLHNFLKFLLVQILVGMTLH